MSITRSEAGLASDIYSPPCHPTSVDPSTTRGLGKHAMIRRCEMHYCVNIHLESIFPERER